MNETATKTDPFSGIETERYHSPVGTIRLYRPEHFEAMRPAGRLAAATLDFIAPYVEPGVTTEALDRLIETFMRDQGAIPATLGYKGYPKSSCISINHVICHGIPGERRLENGDILNIDVTVILDGWYGDTSRMFFAGDKISVKARKLTSVTYQCLMDAISIIRPGVKLGDIGAAIQQVAEANRFSVVRDFCGHGLGRVFHDAPSVLHFGKAGTGIELHPGMLFTIEPMINAGRYHAKVLADGWTAVTRDRSLSAQFEHTIGVIENGFEVFTLSPAGLHAPPYDVAPATTAASA